MYKVIREKFRFGTALEFEIAVERAEYGIDSPKHSIWCGERVIEHLASDRSESLLDMRIKVNHGHAAPDLGSVFFDDRFPHFQNLYDIVLSLLGP